MPAIIATTTVKDGAGVNISGGVATLERTGNQTTGPFSFVNALVDGATGTTLAAVKMANTTAVAGDTALVTQLAPTSPGIIPTGTVGSPSATYLSVQGSTSGTPVAVSPPLTTATAVTPTLATTTAYTSGQVIGGILTFTSILSSTQNGIIESITAKFYSTVSTTGLSVSLFKASPAGTYTDHLAAAIVTADTAQLLGTYRLPTAYSDLGNHTIYNLDGIGKSIAISTTSLFAVVTSLGTTAAMGSTSCFTLEVSVLPG